MIVKKSVVYYMMQEMLKGIIPEETDPLKVEMNGSIQYQGILKRVNDLKGRFFTNTSRQAEVVYMSDHYFEPIEDLLDKQRVQLTELEEGAIIENRIGGLLVIRVATGHKYLQVGNVFDSVLVKQQFENMVPSRV